MIYLFNQYVLAIFLLLQCQLCLALEITQVSHAKKYLTDFNNDNLAVTFSISQSASVKLLIFDARDYLIQSIASESELEKGRHTLRWRGKSFDGLEVPKGIYHYTLVAENTNTETPVIYDLTDLTGGKLTKARKVIWEDEKERIQYLLPADALVNIRIGLKDGGPLMKTLVDWLPRRGGKNSELWNGMDQSDLINLGKHKGRDIHVSAYTLSDNTIFVGDDIAANHFIILDAHQHPTREKQDTTKKTLTRVNPSKQHPNERGDVAIQLGVVGNYSKNNDTLPIVSGRVPFKLDVDDKDKEKALNKRFEAVFYVDGIKVYENEIGFFPMTWYWDTTEVNPGIHFITANLIGYEGSFGLETLKVDVKK